MDAYTLVRTEHLNHNGKLFGGQLLKWVDEYAWLAAAKEFPCNILVTRAMEHIEFRHTVPNGAILRFHMEKVRQGVTSADFTVDVYSDTRAGEREKYIFSNKVTFVAIDEEGKKTPLLVPSNPENKNYADYR